MKCKKGKQGKRELYHYLSSVTEQFQIPTRTYNGTGGFGWNGNTLVMPVNPSKDWNELRIAAHEIAHWLYATPEERKDANFKLGPGDDHREQNVYAIEGLLDKKASITSLINLINSIRQKENVF